MFTVPGRNMRRDPDHACAWVPSVGTITTSEDMHACMVSPVCKTYDPGTPASRNSTPKGEIQHEIQQPVFSKTLVLKRFRKSTNEIQHEIQQLFFCIWVPCCELLEAHTCVHVDGSVTPRNKAPTTPQQKKKTKNPQPAPTTCQRSANLCVKNSS